MAIIVHFCAFILHDTVKEKRTCVQVSCPYNHINPRQGCPNVLVKNSERYLVHYTSIVLDFVWGVFDIRDVSGLGSYSAFKWMVVILRTGFDITGKCWDRTWDLL